MGLIPLSAASVQACAGQERGELKEGKNLCSACNSKTSISSIWSPFGSGRANLFSLWFFYSCLFLLLNIKRR